MRFEKRPLPENQELKKRIRSAALAVMALLSFGGGVYEGRQLERDKLKQNDKIERSDERKEPEIIFEDGGPQEVQPETVAPEPVEPNQPTGPEKNEEEIETQFASAEAASFYQLYDFRHKGKFNYGNRISKHLKKYYHELYDNPNMLAGKQKAYKELSPWLPHIKERVMASGKYDEKLMKILPMVSLVENETLDKKKKFKENEKGAAGPWQFRKKTAIKKPCRLRVDKKIDQRNDTEDAGEASYNLLLDNHRTIGEPKGDFRLSLAAFNGSFVWKFKKEARRKKQEINFDNYLPFLEKEINRIKTNIEEDDRWQIVYKGKGKKRKAFFKTTDRPFVHTGAEREMAFKIRTNGIAQNMNYVFKILELMERDEDGKFKMAPRVNYIEKRLPKRQKPYKISELARQYNIHPEELKKINPKFKEEFISAKNEDLKIRVPQV